MRKDLLIIALGLSLATGVAKGQALATPEANPAAVAFLTYLRGNAARAILRNAGYTF